MLALEIDGPNVNRSFKSTLLEELQKRWVTYFLNVGTCSIHITSNAFLGGIKCLKDNVNVDQFAIDLIFLFQTICSESRRLYLIDVSMQFVIKHYQTRWLSLDKVPLGIIEQQENLKEYFLKTLPKLSFIVHVCQDFKKFVVPLQSTELKIHVLYTKCVKLVKNLLSRFVTKWSFHETDHDATKGRNDPSHQPRRETQGLSFIFLYPKYFVHFISSPIPFPFYFFKTCSQIPHSGLL